MISNVLACVKNTLQHKVYSYIILMQCLYKCTACIAACQLPLITPVACTVTGGQHSQESVMYFLLFQTSDPLIGYPWQYQVQEYPWEFPCLPMTCQIQQEMGFTPQEQTLHQPGVIVSLQSDHLP